MVHIALINAMTFNVTLLQVNHVIIDTNDLYLNLPYSRQESQIGIWKSCPHRVFMSTDMKMSLGKSIYCEISFISLPEAANFIIQWQREKDRAEGNEGFYVFPTSFLPCAKQDQMFQQRNETSHTVFDLWDHPYLKCQLIIPEFEK